MVSCVDFSADGNRIAVGSYDGSARVYDSHGGLIKCLRLSDKYDIQRNLEAIKISDDGRSVLATALFHNVNTYMWKLPV